MPGDLAFLSHFWIVHASKLTFIVLLLDFSTFAVQHQKPWGFSWIFPLVLRVFFVPPGLSVLLVSCVTTFQSTWRLRLASRHLGFLFVTSSFTVWWLSGTASLRLGCLFRDSACAWFVFLDWKCVLWRLVFWSVKYLSAFIFTVCGFSPLYCWCTLSLFPVSNFYWPIVSYFYFLFSHFWSIIHSQ